MDVNILIALLVVALLMIAFLSGVETAFFSAGRLAVELKKKQNKYTGRVWSSYFDNPTRFLAAGLVNSILFLVIYTYLWTLVLDTVWKFWSIDNIYIQLVATLFLSVIALLLIVGVFRAVFHARPNGIIGSGLATFIVAVSFSVFSWLALKMVKMGGWILKYIFNVKMNARIKPLSRPDIDIFARQLKDQNQSERYEKSNEIFENIMSLTDTKIKACLVPRKEIVAVKEDISIEELIKVFSETKLSRLVVYGDTIDDIKGYVHQLDLFRNPEAAGKILHPIPVVPESMNATDLINKFSKERKTIAWVIDEFGGTAGIVTMEDLLEEIFGDIYDEFDAKENMVEKAVSSTEYLFSGRLGLNYIAEKYKLEFRKDQESETLSGYIINQNGRIPKQRERIIIDDYQFEIISMAKTHIDVVRLKILR
ncbi:MAG: HlyC/CorC family transporter [Chitinophagaceae bacterium]|nr:HlyC/CorC family transporter [Chitinophagaceae bacterium]